MNKYSGLGKLYDKDLKVDINVRAFLDEGPIVDWNINSPHRMELTRYDGSKIIFWTENRWYAFACSGSLMDKNNKCIIRWSQKAMSKRNLEILADYYSGVRKPYTNIEPLKGFRCSCGARTSYIEDDSGKMFVFCECGHGGKYKLDMDPKGISTFYFK